MPIPKRAGEPELFTKARVSLDHDDTTDSHWRFALRNVFRPNIGQTSADNPRLKTALERYPEADADKNGILTLEEAHAYREKHTKEPGKNETTAPQGGEWQVYKKIGSTELPLYVYAPANHTADALLEGTELYKKDSEKAGNSCKLVTYEGQGHGFFNYGKSGGKYYDLKCLN